MPFDIPEESIFVLIFLLISFLNWIGEKVKSAKQASARRRPPVRGYEEQPPELPTTQAPTEPAQPEEDPMRQILESLGIPTETPPPVPQPSPPPLEEQTTTAPPWGAQEVVEPVSQVDQESPWALAQLTEAERLAMEKMAGDELKPRRQTNYGISKEARNLLSVGNTKTAFVLKEILDKPKCFES